jgi:hypothetical protein
MFDSKHCELYIQAQEAQQFAPVLRTARQNYFQVYSILIV